MKQKSARELILKLLKKKSTLKQDIFDNTIAQFGELKKILKEISEDLKKEIAGVDKRVIIEYKERSDNEVELRVAGDLLIFHMHSNVFEFDKNHPVWKTSYV